MNDVPPVHPRSTSRLSRVFHWVFSWRTAKRVLIVLAWAATGIALLYAEENWRGRRSWNGYRNDLLARGEQLDLRAYIPKPVPDDQNFASTPFMRGWFNRKLSSDVHWGDQFSDIQGRIDHAVELHGKRRLINLRAWEQGFVGNYENLTNDLPTDAQSRVASARTVLEVLKTMEPVVRELQEASQRPHSVYPVVYDMENPWGILLPHLAHIRGACARLQLRACAELAVGQNEKALEDTKLLFALIGSMREEPFLVDYLVQVACLQLGTHVIWEGVVQHRWTDAQLQELQAKLQNFDFLERIKTPLRSERAAVILTVDLVQQHGNFNYLLNIMDTPVPRRRGFLDPFPILVPGGWYDMEKLKYCRLFDEQFGALVGDSRKAFSPSEVEAVGEKIERLKIGHGIGRIFRHEVSAALMLSGLKNVIAKTVTGQVLADEAYIACGLERYRTAHGKYPEKLEALMPQFVAKLPGDLIGGRGYQYKPTAGDSYLLYSLGWNGRDDGGTPGRTLFDEKQGDWVWQCP